MGSQSLIPLAENNKWTFHNHNIHIGTYTHTAYKIIAKPIMICIYRLQIGRIGFQKNYPKTCSMQNPTVDRVIRKRQRIKNIKMVQPNNSMWNAHKYIVDNNGWKYLSVSVEQKNFKWPDSIARKIFPIIISYLWTEKAKKIWRKQKKWRKFWFHLQFIDDHLREKEHKTNHFFIST